jgi:hypothetical protein
MYLHCRSDNYPVKVAALTVGGAFGAMVSREPGDTKYRMGLQ